MKLNIVKALALCAALLGGGSGMAERAEARQALDDIWGSSSPVYNGSGGAAHPDRAVSSHTVNVTYDDNSTATVTFTAAQTWVANGSSYWPALMIRRVDYATGAALDTGPFIYPSAPSASNYFVPTAMKVYRNQEMDSGPGQVWVVVTGYGPAASYGQTDIRTVAFNGILTFRWDHAFSKVVSGGRISAPDEYAVDMDLVPSSIAVTGNVWTGSNWDIETVFYDLDGGSHGSFEEGSTGTDMATGVVINSATGGTNADDAEEALVIGTLNMGSSADTIVGYRYYWGTDNAWHADTARTRSLIVSGSTLTANAMTAFRSLDPVPGVAVVSGKITSSSATDMLMIKFDFTNANVSWYTSFDAPAHGTDEAFSVAANFNYYAMGGTGYRGTSFGSDALVTLFQEVSGSPVLQWSAWMSGTSETGTVTKTCKQLAIDQDASNPDVFYTYAGGQTPNGSNVQWRIGVFDNDTTSVADPTNPIDKLYHGNSLNVTGGLGNDIPLHMEFNPVNSPYLHMFLITGDIYDGSSAGDDVTVHKFQFIP